MYLTEEQLKKYTCKLETKFFQTFVNEYKDNWVNSDTELIDSNDLLAFLLDYPEVNDKSKEYFYFMCMKTFNDVPHTLSKKFKIKFGLVNCGNEIYNSYACAHSNLLIECNGVKQSFGCNKCKFSAHLLYCDSIRHATYMAFNKPVTKQRFQQLVQMSPQNLKDVPEFDKGLYDKINNMMEYIYRLK